MTSLDHKSCGCGPTVACLHKSYQPRCTCGPNDGCDNCPTEEEIYYVMSNFAIGFEDAVKMVKSGADYKAAKQKKMPEQDDDFTVGCRKNVKAPPKQTSEQHAEDIKYFQGKLYKALKIPEHFIGWTDEHVYRVMSRYMVHEIDAKNMLQKPVAFVGKDLVRLCKHIDPICDRCPEDRKVKRPEGAPVVLGWIKHPAMPHTHMCFADDGMELHKCTLCNESRRYDQTHGSECKKMKLKLYRNGEFQEPDSNDHTWDYNITISDDIYLMMRRKLETGDILLFRTKNVEISHRIGSAWDAYTYIPLKFEIGDDIFKVFPFLEGKLPIGMDITPPHASGCVIQTPQKIYTNVKGQQACDTGDAWVSTAAPDEGLTDDERINVINEGYARAIADRVEQRIKVKHANYWVYVTCVEPSDPAGSNSTTNCWQIKVSASKALKHIASFLFFAPKMTNKEGEIDSQARDRCAEVEDHVVKVVLGGIKAHG